MPVNILMPALSPTMEKGNLAKWLKKEGDTVKAGDVIAEIETDKATMEVEAVDEGTLGKIVVPEGTPDVPVNQVIAVLLEEGEDKTAISQAKPTQPASKPAAPPKAPAAAPTPAPAPQAPAARPPAATNGKGHERKGPDAQGADGKGPGGIFASPLARRLAKDAGIEITRVQGSGPHG